MTDIDEYIEDSKNRLTFKEGPACPVGDCHNDGFLTDLSPREGWPFGCAVCGVVFDPETGDATQGNGTLSMPSGGEIR